MPTQLKAAPVSTTTLPASPSDSTASSLIMARLGEIMDMDKSSLSRRERKDLRNELRDMKKPADGRVYVSVGALILIVLLLILLL